MDDKHAAWADRLAANMLDQFPQILHGDNQQVLNPHTPQAPLTSTLEAMLHGIGK